MIKKYFVKEKYTYSFDGSAKEGKRISKKKIYEVTELIYKIILKKVLSVIVFLMALSSLIWASVVEEHSKILALLVLTLFSLLIMKLSFEEDSSVKSTYYDESEAKEYVEYLGVKD